MPGREVVVVVLKVVEGGDCSGGGGDCGGGKWSWNEGGVEGERSAEET